MGSLREKFQHQLVDLKNEFEKLLHCPKTWEEQSLIDRIRRSISWLERAACLPQADTPPRFVDLWIGFNALYGCRTYERGFPSKERRDFENFIRKLKRLDEGNQSLVHFMKRKQIKVWAIGLIENPYLWKEFWKKEFDGLKKFSMTDRKEAEKAIRAEDPVPFFVCLFKRMLVLRNQIFHGSSSATTKRNRDALLPSIRLLEEFIPLFIRIMVNNGTGKHWGALPYPGHLSPQHPVRVNFKTTRELLIYLRRNISSF